MCVARGCIKKWGGRSEKWAWWRSVVVGRSNTGEGAHLAISKIRDYWGGGGGEGGGRGSDLTFGGGGGGGEEGSHLAKQVYSGGGGGGGLHLAKQVYSGGGGGGGGCI